METRVNFEKRLSFVGKNVSSSIERGLEYLATVQSEEGSWKNDYSGPLFLLPGYVFAHFCTHTLIPETDRIEFIRYIASTQNKDGGFGLHVESKSYLFTTVLNYVALRMLGVQAQDPQVVQARDWIRGVGGAIGVPSWGKIWLALLGLYEYEGLNPVLPEMWLLPRWFPLHPGKMWCHSRVIYLAASYLYGRKWRASNHPIIGEFRDELRSEIFVEKYGEINFRKMRNTLFPGDLYVAHSLALKALNGLLVKLEALIPKKLRDRALEKTLDHIHHEQLSTGFADIGPINKALDVVACYAAAPDSPHTRKAIQTLRDYICPDEHGHGLFMQSYLSCEIWDTSFSLQTLMESGKTKSFRPMLEKAYRFIDENQIRDDVDRYDSYFRDRSLGAWGFSNAKQGWPVSDCTAEGIKALIAAEGEVGQPVAEQRILEAVDRILFWQHDDGGWPSYERRRIHPFFEILNPAEVFGDIMTEHSHVECSSSCIQALVAVKRRYGSKLELFRMSQINRAIARGTQFLRSAQREDGSWEGFWGICFTYATWFGTWGLLAAGISVQDRAIRKAVKFLLSKQLPDGGWGESYMSCVDRKYIQHSKGSRISMTAWALLALLKAGGSETREAVKKGLSLLMHRQLENGDWPDDGVNGVFNRTCMLKYRFYRNYFPIWALSLAEANRRPV